MFWLTCLLTFVVVCVNGSVFADEIPTEQREPVYITPTAKPQEQLDNCPPVLPNPLHMSDEYMQYCGYCWGDQRGLNTLPDYIYNPQPTSTNMPIEVCPTMDLTVTPDWLDIADSGESYCVTLPQGERINPPLGKDNQYATPTAYPTQDYSEEQLPYGLQSVTFDFTFDPPHILDDKTRFTLDNGVYDPDMYDVRVSADGSSVALAWFVVFPSPVHIENIWYDYDISAVPAEGDWCHTLTFDDDDPLLDYLYITGYGQLWSGFGNPAPGAKSTLANKLMEVQAEIRFPRPALLSGMEMDYYITSGTGPLVRGLAAYSNIDGWVFGSSYDVINPVVGQWQNIYYVSGDLIEADKIYFRLARSGTGSNPPGTYYADNVHFCGSGVDPFSDIIVSSVSDVSASFSSDASDLFLSDLSTDSDGRIYPCGNEQNCDIDYAYYVALGQSVTVENASSVTLAHDNITIEYYYMGIGPDDPTPTPIIYMPPENGIASPTPIDRRALRCWDVQSYLADRSEPIASILDMPTEPFETTCYKFFPGDTLNDILGVSSNDMWLCVDWYDFPTIAAMGITLSIDYVLVLVAAWVIRMLWLV